LRDFLIIGLGFFAQALFGARMIVQWIKSEREHQVLSPSIFWKLSLVASLLFTVYGFLRHDVVIVIGQFLNYYIYIRNLQLKKDWQTLPQLIRYVLLVAPLLLTALSLVNSNFSIPANIEFFSFWIAVGLMGQMILNFRFIYQWVQSEKSHESMFPVGFWVISIAGSILVIAYGIVRSDPVLIVSQGMGMVVYSRNIFLSLRSSAK
jgi:lipid-A-disaccharide synthase-like uncharacterized protein